jgi:hypothetical protein
MTALLLMDFQRMALDSYAVDSVSAFTGTNLEGLVIA